MQEASEVNDPFSNAIPGFYLFQGLSIFFFKRNFAYGHSRLRRFDDLAVTGIKGDVRDFFGMIGFRGKNQIRRLQAPRA